LHPQRDEEGPKGGAEGSELTIDNSGRREIILRFLRLCVVYVENFDPFSVFDWYFADAGGEDAARFRALKERPSETRIVQDLVSADSIVHFALWSELPKNHPVGELWLETQTDLQASIYLAYGGFFRQALTVLRAWFEIAVHGVFFSAHPVRYQQWRKGQRNAPVNMKALAQSLAARNDKLIAEDEATILGKLDPVYRALSQHSHGRGLDLHDLQEGRDNVPRYLPKSYDAWYSSVLSAFDVVCFLYRIFFAKYLSSYLQKTPAEKERVHELSKHLSPSMPDFGKLISDAFRYL